MLCEKKVQKILSKYLFRNITIHFFQFQYFNKSFEIILFSISAKYGLSKIIIFIFNKKNYNYFFNFFRLRPHEISVSFIHLCISLLTKTDLCLIDQSSIVRQKPHECSMIGHSLRILIGNTPKISYRKQNLSISEAYQFVINISGFSYENNLFLMSIRQYLINTFR